MPLCYTACSVLVRGIIRANGEQLFLLGGGGAESERLGAGVKEAEFLHGKRMWMK